MGRMFYFVTFIGVFLQAVHGQDLDKEKMKQCPCANGIIENFAESVSKDTLDNGNGQKLRLRVWPQKNNVCSVHILDMSPKPGRIEINMSLQANVIIEEQGEGEDQYRSDNDEQQQGGQDIGQQPEGMDIGQLQEDGDIEPQQGADIAQQQTAQDGGFLKASDLEEMLKNIDLEELQERLAELLEAVNTAQEQAGEDNAQEQVGAEDAQEQAELDIAQEQAGVDAAQEQVGEDTAQKQVGEDTAQEQSKSSYGSYVGAGGDKKDYATKFSFTVDVNTGKLSTESSPVSNRRKRELMPFDTVVININAVFDKKLDSAETIIKNMIESLFGRNLGEYWLKMAFCLLDVKE